MRKLVIVSSLIAAAAPAFADTAANKIDPAKKGPTESVTDAVPDMKGTTSGAAKSDVHPPTKNVGDAVPPMQPNDGKAKSAAGETKSDTTKQ